MQTLFSVALFRTGEDYCSATGRTIGEAYAKACLKPNWTRVIGLGDENTFPEYPSNYSDRFRELLASASGLIKWKRNVTSASATDGYKTATVEITRMTV